MQWKATPAGLVFALLASCFRPEQATHSLMLCTQLTADQSNLVGNTVIDTLSTTGDILRVGHREVDVSEVDPDVNWFPRVFTAQVRRAGETQITISAVSVEGHGYMVNLHGPETKVRAELLATRWKEASNNAPVFIFPGNGVNSEVCKTAEELPEPART